MDDPFSQWTEQLRRDGLGPQNLNAITRGLPHAFTILWNGDFSDAGFTARASSAPDATTPLASWTATVGAFANGVTPVSFTLAASAQSALPEDVGGDGVIVMPYDIVCSPQSGSEYRIVGGYVPISGAIPR